MTFISRRNAVRGR